MKHSGEAAILAYLDAHWAELGVQDIAVDSNDDALRVELMVCEVADGKHAKHTHHSKARHFMVDEAPEEVFAKLRETTSLFADMVAQKPLEYEHAAHDKHDHIAPELMRQHNWTQIFKRSAS